LFPFSLSREAKQWYIPVVGCLNWSRTELRNRFYSASFLLSRICALRTEVLTFRQNDKKLIGVAWPDLPYWFNHALTCNYPSIYCSSFMLVLTRSLHTTSIFLLEDLSLILPQPKAEKSLIEFWTENFLRLYPRANSSRTRGASRTPLLNLNVKHQRKRTLYLRSFSKVLSTISLRITFGRQFKSWQSWWAMNGCKKKNHPWARFSLTPLPRHSIAVYKINTWTLSIAPLPEPTSCQKSWR
jgi:hypothetical protein